MCLFDEVDQGGADFRRLLDRHDGQGPGRLGERIRELLQRVHRLRVFGALGVGQGRRISVGDDRQRLVQRGDGEQGGAGLGIVGLADRIDGHGGRAAARGKQARHHDEESQERAPSVHHPASRAMPSNPSVVGYSCSTPKVFLIPACWRYHMTTTGSSATPRPYATSPVEKRTMTA